MDDDTVERWFRFSDGRLSRMDRKRQGSSGFLKQKAYDYDLDANRTQDERGTHEFNSRDQLVLWNPDTAGKPDVTYTLNGSGGIKQRIRGNEVTAYHYGPGDERLDHADVTVGGVPAGTTNYSYDSGFGDVTEYQVVGAPEPVATFVYDAFGRQTHATSGAKDETFSYDGLDRRDTKTAGTKWFDLSYVGLSEALSQESQFAGGDERRSYDYTSTLERVGTARKPDGVAGEAPYRAYSLDANGSVEGLQDNTGEDSAERYGYDPYGEALNAFGNPQVEGALSEDQQANPFRFEGHYYDAAFKTYDMKARAYLPEIGRFLQEDHYEQALGDQALETDPLTQDRYAFAGGNPLNNIEFDGHYAPTGDQSSRHIQTYGGDVQDRQTGRTVSGPRQSTTTSDRSGYSDNRSPTDSSKPYLARRIKASPVAPQVVGDSTLDELRQRSARFLMELYQGKSGGYDGYGILDFERRRWIEMYRGKVPDWQGFLFGDSPLEVAVNIVPVGRVANVARRAGGAVVRSIRGVENGSPALARRLGLEGERAAGIDAAAKRRIPSLTGSAAFRVPDALTATTLTEVKNTARIGLTPQIRDYISYAERTNRELVLVIRQNTRVSRGLEDVLLRLSSPVHVRRSLPVR